MVTLIDYPEMTIAVYRELKATTKLIQRCTKLKMTSPEALRQEEPCERADITSGLLS